MVSTPRRWFLRGVTPLRARRPRAGGAVLTDGSAHGARRSVEKALELETGGGAQAVPESQRVVPVEALGRCGVAAGQVRLGKNAVRALAELVDGDGPGGQLDRSRDVPVCQQRPCDALQ